MKKNILMLVLGFCFLGCSKDNSSKDRTALETWMTENGKIKVLSTTAMIDDLVGQIGKEHIDHLPLILGEIDPHSYELVKGDDEKLSFAKIIFSNGLGLEHGASLRYRLKVHPHTIFIGDEIQKHFPQLILTMDKQIDPHIWLDISTWAKAIDPIVQALSTEDPGHAGEYRENGEELRKTMMAVDGIIYDNLQKVPSSKRFLVTSHDAFNYFTRRYLAERAELAGERWRKRFTAPEGLAPEGQLSVSDIQNVIDHLALYHISVMFPESNVSRDSLKKIVSASREKGMDVRIAEEVLYGDSMGAKESYLDMMKHNAAAMEKEWDHE